MGNVKLYEEFTGNVTPDAGKLKLEISELLGIKEEFSSKKPSPEGEVWVKWGEKYSDILIPNLIKNLKDKGYKLSFYPENLDEISIRIRILRKNVDFQDLFYDLEYGVCILVECTDKGVQKKLCVNIDREYLHFILLGEGMSPIKTKVFKEKKIELLFWNGDYMVTGSFQMEDVYRDDDIVSLGYSSYITSDNIGYTLSVSAYGSFNAGYELDDIEYIDFL